MEFLGNVLSVILATGLAVGYLYLMWNLMMWPFRVIGKVVGKEVAKECACKCKEHK
jgi:hypothetical protein